MGAFDIVFVPHLPLVMILILTVACVALVGAGLLLRAPGAWWRAAAMAAALLVLANPAIVEEERKGLPDVAVIVADQTQSQAIGDRSKTVDDTVTKLRAKLSQHKDLDVRVITVTEDRSVQDGGTSLFGPVADAFADVPPDRVAGAILVTDGQVHDVPAGAAAKLSYPVHALLTGQPDERDRKLTIEQAPRYGIVGEPLTFTVRVDDFGLDGQTVADLEVRIDGKVVLNETAKTGEPKSLELTLPHGGENVIEIQAGAGPKELTLLNNRAAVVTTGIRDQLRVLLVSGEPHAGERTLRNLLKADPSVSLVHFTILRPPEKQDGTPVDELSLIAFPTRELFDEKLNDFNLIIFDRYQRRGVLPLAYYENVARYVENGGALRHSGRARRAHLRARLQTAPHRSGRAPSGDRRPARRKRWQQRSNLGPLVPPCAEPSPERPDADARRRAAAAPGTEPRAGGTRRFATLRSRVAVDSRLRRRRPASRTPAPPRSLAHEGAGA
jgi:hypothetical protein